MDRRDFLKTTGAAAAATVAVPPADAGPRGEGDAPATPPAISGGARELTLAMPWPEHSASFGDSAFRLARRIEAATGGRLRIRIVHAPNGGLEAVMLGEADLYHGTEQHHLGFEPALAYFGGLPYFCGLEPHDLAAWLSVAGGQTLWDEIGAGLGVKPLLAGHSGRAPGLWSTQEINSVRDLSAKPIYVLGLARDVVRAFGGEPAVLSAADIPRAFSDGRLLAAEWGGALAAMSLGIPNAAKFHIGLGINNAGTALSFGVRRSLWDRLDAADQAIFEACAAEEWRLSLAESRAHENVLRDVLREAHGVKLESLPGDLMAALSGAADDVVAGNAGRSADAGRVHERYMAFRKALSGLEPPRLGLGA